MSDIILSKHQDEKKFNRVLFTRISITIILFLNVLILKGIFSIYITNFVCIFYPIYLTLYNIELENNDINNKWISYWIIFAIFSLVDNFERFIPYYLFLKYNFLVWCFFPNCDGSVFIYNRLLYKIIKLFEKDKDYMNRLSPISEFSKTSRKVSEMHFTPN